MSTMYVDDVFTVDLVPAVRVRRPGVTGLSDSWTEDQIKLLVHLRKERRLNWHAVAKALQRPWKSCQRKYRAMKQEPDEAPEPKPLSADAPKPHRLHEELGIQTYTVTRSTQISVPRVGNFTYIDKVMSITLSAGHK